MIDDDDARPNVADTQQRNRPQKTNETNEKKSLL
jgi:hypothetical protein